MSLNIFVSQRHIQTLQIRNTKKTGMCAEDLHRLERNSYQMRLRFYTFVAKMTNICCWESQIWKKGGHSRLVAKLLHSRDCENEQWGIIAQKSYSKKKCAVMNSWQWAITVWFLPFPLLGLHSSNSYIHWRHCINVRNVYTSSTKLLSPHVEGWIR